MNILAALASLSALITFLIHTFAGGREVARPLLADTHLPPASKWLNYYCWHITTVLLAAMTIAFAATALDPRFAAFPLLLGPLALCLSGLSAIIAMKAGIAPLRLPSTSLFALTGALGIAAIIAAPA
ncbi:hypothetical protein [Maricaulis maris]|uniref:DUF423 domain-containing protein n=1 Tax=Maricaulis maris TaxID=74318 RepID=A0A495DN40_9PROT|nr:hypothetical protein [Maricaulis maris]RKR04070.1 hypothetical protein C7435_0513 [Maricaulis maris]